MPRPPYVIGIDGRSGAGKTALAAQLADHLGDTRVVHLDAMYPGWSGLAAVVPRLVAWVLEPVSVGRRARWRRWDWAAGRFAEWHQLEPCAVLVIDGVGVGARDCAPYLDLLLWLDAPEAVRYQRAMGRDGVGFRPHWQRWAAAERAYLEREGTRERADVVLAR